MDQGKRNELSDAEKPFGLDVQNPTINTISMATKEVIYCLAIITSCGLAKYDRPRCLHSVLEFRTFCIFVIYQYGYEHF